MIRNILLISFISFAPLLSAQSALTFPSAPKTSGSEIVNHLQENKAGYGKITMYHEVALDSLINLSKEVSEQNGMMGYTVQLFRGNNGQESRKMAEKIKSEYLSNNPEGEINVVYTNPNWRVQVGGYRTNAEAMKAKVEIEKLMPSYKDQIYIVRLKLNDNSLKSE